MGAMQVSLKMMSKGYEFKVHTQDCELPVLMAAFTIVIICEPANATHMHASTTPCCKFVFILKA